MGRSVVQRMRFLNGLVGYVGAVALVTACEKSPPRETIATPVVGASVTVTPPALASTPAAASALPDAVTPAEQKALRDCDAEASYYGIGRPVDYVAARTCAYAERATGSAPVIGGAGILLMVYANGRGVPVDLDLALRFARECGGAPAELEGRVARLEEAKAAGKLEKELDFCDDVTSGLMAGFCARRDERIRNVTRDARMRDATRALPREPIARLDKARAAFFAARSMLEVDLTGTARAAMSIAEESRLADDDLAMLQRLVDPTFTPQAGDAAKAEGELQRAYDALMKCKRRAPKALPGEIEADGILKTERLWIAYREAWLALVAPEKRSAWKAWLAEKRTAMLKELSDGC